MKNISKFLSLLFIVSIIVVLPQVSTFGQKVYSLEECIKIAQKNNLDIKQALLSERETRVLIKYAKHQMLPSLNANSSFSYNIGRGIDPTTNSYLSKSFFSQGLNLNTSYTIYNGKIIQNKIKEAIINRKASIEDLIQMKEDIALYVTDIYLSILYNKENLNNANNQYKATKKQLEKMNQFVKAGVKLISEAKNLEAQLLFDNEKIISIQNELEISYQDLKTIMMLDKNNLEIKIPNLDILDFSTPIIETITNLQKSAIQNNHGINAAAYRIKSAGLQEDIAYASLLPSIKIGGGLSTNYSDKTQEVTGFEDTISQQIMIIDGASKVVGVPSILPIFENQTYFSQLKNNWGVGLWLQVNIPIYNNYSTKAQIQKAKLNIESARISKEKIVQKIKTKVQKTFSELKAAKSKYLASKKANDAQKIVFDIATKQYELGVMGIYDYLNTKTALEQSQNRLLIAKYQYVFKSKILDFYIGKNRKLKYK